MSVYFAELGSTFVNLLPVSLAQSLIYAFVALGVMMPLRLLSFPDLTSEGSFPLGGSICGALLASGFHSVGATLAAVVAGILAGCSTALIHIHFRINTLLCGILVLTMLYSVNLRIMGKPNTALFAYVNVLQLIDPAMAPSPYFRIVFVGVIVLLVTVLLFWYLHTEAGMSLRAVGANPTMAAAQGVHTRFYTVVGLGLAGGAVALGGAILVQAQGFADVNMGFGVLINGLAALIIGETLIGRRTVLRQVLAPVIGAVIYYQLVSLCLAAGLAPSDLKFATGAFVLVAMAVPAVRGQAVLERMRE